MKNLVFNAIFLLSIFSCSVKATTGDGDKKEVHFMEATSQKTYPGMRGAEPFTNYHFVIDWKGKEKPENAFWFGDGRWYDCKVMLQDGKLDIVTFARATSADFPKKTFRENSLLIFYLQENLILKPNVITKMADVIMP